VGNVGLNTPYQASASQPALIYYGDFKGDGGRQLVEAYHEGGHVYPWRSRRDLGAAIPWVLKKFPRNDYYARATLGEVLGEERLAAARRFEATEFRSGVFVGKPDGTFTFAPLPRIAQISPFQGLVATDLDGDGRADIFAAQNSFSPVPYVGRFDGGLGQLLLGNGKGEFNPETMVSSGIVVPGDAKAAAVVDLGADGWPSLLVTRNNSTTLAFRNSGVAGRRSLRVMLRGPAGNPTGVGSRVEAESRDGTVQTCEVYAGSGYMTQSSSACFFGMSASNPVARIRVRWPSGASSAHEVSGSAPVLVISAPQA
jgi:enediyne biosynthesis protein E4